MRRKEDIRRTAIRVIVAQVQSEAVRRRLITLLVQTVQQTVATRRRISTLQAELDLLKLERRQTHVGSSMIH